MAGRAGHRGWGHVRKERSGRWSASYVGPDGERHRAPMTYEKRRDADDWLVDERRALERDSRGTDVWTPPRAREAQRRMVGETLAVFGERWIRERPLKARTRAEYESKFALHIVPVLGDVAVRSFTADRVRSWYADLDAAYAPRNAGVYALLKAIFETAVGDGLLASNPCQIKGAAQVTRIREPVELSSDDVARIAASEKMPDRYRVMVLLSAWCGFRWGEVIELRRGDVSADCTMLTVKRAVTHRGKCDIGTTKTSDTRRVSVPPHIQGDLAAHLREHVGPEGDSLLFTPMRGGCHVNDKVFSEGWFRPALADAGVKDGAVFHDLRHFAGTTAAQAGATMAETMRRLGHKTTKAAMVYQSASVKRDEEIAKALSKKARPKKNAAGRNAAV